MEVWREDETPRLKDRVREEKLQALVTGRTFRVSDNRRPTIVALAAIEGWRSRSLGRPRNCNQGLLRTRESPLSSLGKNCSSRKRAWSLDGAIFYSCLSAATSGCCQISVVQKLSRRSLDKEVTRQAACLPRISIRDSKRPPASCLGLLHKLCYFQLVPWPH